MQIKSWQIVLLSLISPLIILIQMISCTNNCENADEFFTEVIIIGIVVTTIIITAVLLIASKTKKIGAFLSIIFGAIYVFLIISISISDNPGIGFFGYLLMLLPVFFLFVAGIHYFWKKV